MESLRHKRGAGRPRILTEQQVQRHIVQPIRRSNRLHRAIHYQPIRANLIANSVLRMLAEPLSLVQASPLPLECT